MIKFTQALFFTHIEVEFNKYLAGKGAKFTKMNSHSYIMAIEQYKNRSEASQLEDQHSNCLQTKTCIGFSLE